MDPMSPKRKSTTRAAEGSPKQLRAEPSSSSAAQIPSDQERQGRQADRETERQTDRQTDRQAGRQAGRQADRQTDRSDRQDKMGRNPICRSGEHIMHSTGGHSNHLAVHQWFCFAIPASQHFTSPISLLSWKLPPLPSEVLPVWKI